MIYLFRGKSTWNGEWIKGNFIKMGFTTRDGICEYTVAEEGCYPVKVAPETVGQYINFNDKNDTRIFDGDIVEFDDDKIGVITYDKDEACWVVKSSNYVYTFSIFHSSDLEIIGNIHDNPELLEEVKVEDICSICKYKESYTDICTTCSRVAWGERDDNFDKIEEVK